MAEELAHLVADVYEAAGALRRAGEALAGAEGQTQARWQLMSVVREEPLPVARAARRLGVARQGVQRIATGLVRDGLAEFQDNPDHRTSPLLTLTGAGQRTLGAITGRADAAHQAMGEGLSEHDLAAARAVLQRLTRQADDWTDTASPARGARPHAGTVGTGEEGV
ncbi:MarR family winged helix-turn-helix transcriptional regulator [Streptomyces microflavus]|uniref:MarR family winged helix-turn-helix transcriptional regulator n=1 Tax=Streptomyces microflavus TaxID=1919 RepID=UPI0033A69081